jgi:DNA-binding HxlR family transcriptional regulator
MTGRTPDLLAALGRRDGQHVLARLIEHPARVGELADRAAGISQPTVSRRLSELEAIGLVDHGLKKDVYSLTRPDQLRPLLRGDRRHRDTALWAALGRPHAVELMLLLIAQPRTTSEITELIAGLDLRTASRRLAELVATRAVRRDPAGRYRVTSAARIRALLRTLSQLASDLLEADLAAEQALLDRLA